MDVTLSSVLLLLLGLQFKHFIADYLLQTAWIINGKGSFRHAGGYVHAGIHAIGTAAVLGVVGLPANVVIILALGEFVLHYLLDYAKFYYSSGISSSERPHAFWSLNGLDQFLHHATYLAIAYIALSGGLP